MLPRLVLRVRRAVRRLKVAEPQQSDLSGLDNRERWQAMLSEIDERGRAAERRLAEAEQALNRLGLN
ncbi:MAG: hypothetical protein ACTHKD_14750 [Devosia sp.]|nr:hypothetical protein [Devosia sp.]